MHDPIQAAAEEIAAWFDEESIKEAAHLMSEQKAVLKLNLESIIRRHIHDREAELREALILACNTITDWQTGKGDTGVSNAVLSGLHLTLMRLYKRPIHEILGESAALEKTSAKVGK